MRWPKSGCAEEWTTAGAPPTLARAVQAGLVVLLSHLGSHCALQARPRHTRSLAGERQGHAILPLQDPSTSGGGRDGAKGAGACDWAAPAAPAHVGWRAYEPLHVASTTVQWLPPLSVQFQMNFRAAHQRSVQKRSTRPARFGLGSLGHPDSIETLLSRRASLASQRIKWWGFVPLLIPSRLPVFLPCLVQFNSLPPFFSHRSPW